MPGIVFLILLLVASLTIIYFSVSNGIGPMPTTGRQQEALLKNVRFPMHGLILELGSGWGTVAVALARRNPNCAVVGYENSFMPLLFSKGLAFLMRVPNLEFHRGNIYRVPLTGASFIFCYLYPGAMARLKTRFEQEVSSDCCIVSNTFAVPEWKPEQVIEVNDLYRNKIYLYQRP